MSGEKKSKDHGYKELPDELTMRGKYFDDDGFDDVDFEVKYGGRMPSRREKIGLHDKHTNIGGDSYAAGVINCVGKYGGVNGGQAGILRSPLSVVPDGSATGGGGSGEEDGKSMSEPFEGSSYNRKESDVLSDNFGVQHIPEKEKKNEKK